MAWAAVQQQQLLLQQQEAGLASCSSGQWALTLAAGEPLTAGDTVGNCHRSVISSSTVTVLNPLMASL
jgi:hypothetical protein